MSDLRILVRRMRSKTIANKWVKSWARQREQWPGEGSRLLISAMSPTGSVTWEKPFHLSGIQSLLFNFKYNVYKIDFVSRSKKKKKKRDSGMLGWEAS